MPKAIKARLAGYALIAIIGAAGIATVVIIFNPENAGAHIFTGLYFSVLIFTFGLFAALLTVFKFYFGFRVTLLKSSTAVLRQAFLLGVAAMLGSVFQGLKLLNPLTGSLLIVSIGLLESYFINREAKE